MATKNIQSKYKELVSKLKRWNEAYYLNDAPEVDDAVYDAHMQELLELEKDHPDLVTADSPSQYAGADASSTKFSKITHEVPMISLANAFGEQEIREWEERINRIIGAEAKREYVFELKIDGLSIHIDYQDGKLVRAATRGDGKVGEDVTENVRTIKTLPQQVGNKAKFSVRGEVFINKSDFLKINTEQEKSGATIYANPRNTAAGSLRQLDPKVTASRHLDAFLYNFISDDIDYKTHSESLQIMADAGFKTNKDHNVVCKTIDEVIELYHKWIDQRHDLDYEIDGAVVKINQLDLQNTLGSTAKSPRWAIALKFPAEIAETQIEEVVFEVGRLGTITPVANLSPVKLAGTTVKRATLHNFDQIERLGVSVKDWVQVRKAGEIIPEIVEVNKAKRPKDAQVIAVPKACPVCSSDLEKVDVAYFCTNIASCPAQVQRRIEHWCSKGAMDIGGVGPALVAMLLEAKMIESPLDLYKLSVEDLMPLERMAEKSAQNAIASIAASRTQSFARLLFALGIKHIGANVAELIASYYSDLESLEAEIKTGGEGILKIDGLGPKIVESLQEFFLSTGYKNFCKELAKNPKLLDIQKLESKQLSNLLEGKSFVITGTLQESRGHYESLIKENGGKVSSSVSKKTSYLLCGESPGSKYDKAEKLGVEIINEEAFLAILKS